MQQSNQWDLRVPLQDSDNDSREIDIHDTDSESESDYSVHESDKNFIDPQDDLYDLGDSDPSYTDELSSLASSNNDFNGKLWEKGNYDEFDVLDKRHIEGVNGKVSQV